MAETLIAYFTLGFSFVFSWSELVVYIYAIIINDQGYWSDPPTGLIWEGRDAIPTVQQDSERFEPISASYELYSGPTSILINQFGSAPLGTSAPISIGNPRQTKAGYSELSNSLADKQVEETILGNHDVYRNFVTRHSELQNIFTLILGTQLSEADALLKRNSKHMVLPGFAFASMIIEIYRNDFNFTKKNLLDKLSKVKTTINMWGKIKDRDLMSKAFAGTVSVEILNSYRPFVAQSNLSELESPNTSDAFWNLLDLHILCCKTELQLLEGLVQLYHRSYIKSSVNLSNSFKNYEKVVAAISSMNQITQLISNGPGIIIEAIQAIRTMIGESNQLVLCSFRILPSVYPYFATYYLKKQISLENRVSGLRNLYQLARKSTTKALTSSILFLTAIRLTPAPYFSTKDTPEQGEILSMLTSIRDAFQLPQQQFLVYQCYSHLGLLELAQKECSYTIKVARNQTLRVHSQLDYCILSSLSLNWNGSVTAVNELWKERKSIHASGDAEAVDVIIGLFVVALHNFQPVSDLESKSVLNYIQDIILPILIDKEINIHSLGMDVLYKLPMEMLLAERGKSRHFIFWFWLVHGNLLALSQARSSVSYLVNLSLLLKNEHEKRLNSVLENVIYGLVQGTLLAYIVYSGQSSVPHFPNTSNIALLSRTLLSSAIEMHTQLNNQDALFGLYPRLLFQQAELEFVHFERQDIAFKLLTLCHGQLSHTAIIKSPATIVTEQKVLPSFARVKELSSKKLDADSVSDISASFLSQGDSAAVEQDLTRNFYDFNLKEACQNALTQLDVSTSKN